MPLNDELAKGYRICPFLWIGVPRIIQQYVLSFVFPLVYVFTLSLPMVLAVYGFTREKLHKEWENTEIFLICGIISCLLFIAAVPKAFKNSMNAARGKTVEATVGFTVPRSIR